MSPDDIAALPALIKLGDVAAIAGVSKPTVRRLIAAGKMPPPYHGQFFRKADVLRALAMVLPDTAIDAAPSPWASGLDNNSEAEPREKKQFSIGEWSHRNRRSFAVQYDPDDPVQVEAMKRLQTRMKSD